MDLNNKYDILRKKIKSYGSLAVAFSGGLDSTFLLKVAFDVLGKKAIAITAHSATYPDREYKEASDFAAGLGIEHIVIIPEELEIEEFTANLPERCYFCKYELFTKIKQTAKDKGIEFVADGSNVDDQGDYRPGIKALESLGVLSPLKEAGMTKADIRALSKDMGLPTWDKPPFACLASRIPYGTRITKEKLEMVEKAEQYLLDMGFRQVRVRYHGEIARIEVSEEEMEKIFNKLIMDKIYNEFRRIGFNYTALDLKGYRTGSMNEVLALNRQG
jgi:uncharacterized protein